MDCALRGILDWDVLESVGVERTHGWHRGKVTGGQCAGLVVGPDVDVALQAEEDVVSFLVVVEADWIVRWSWH